MTTGRVCVDGAIRGIGFAVDRRTVLTARHVIRTALNEDDQQKPGSRILLQTNFGDLSATVGACDRSLDVASLILDDAVSTWVTAVEGRDGTPWRVLSRPADTDPALSGVITTCARPLRTEQGYDAQLLQLQVIETVGDFEGYSGSPVEIAGEDLPPLAAVGMLIEQSRWRVRPRGQLVAPVANVLYAVPLPMILSALRLQVHLAEPPDLETFRKRMARIAAVRGEADERMLDEAKKEVIFRYVFGE